MKDLHLVFSIFVVVLYLLFLYFIQYVGFHGREPWFIAKNFIAFSYIKLKYEFETNNGRVKFLLIVTAINFYVRKRENIQSFTIQYEKQMFLFVNLLLIYLIWCIESNELYEYMSFYLYTNKTKSIPIHTNLIFHTKHINRALISKDKTKI